MWPRTLKHLEDIRDAAAFILDTVGSLTLNTYKHDRLTRQAVERNLEIVGEAMNRLAKEGRESAERLGDYPRIIAFRSVLAHGYDLVDDDVVWRVLRESLPELRLRVEALLGRGP